MRKKDQKKLKQIIDNQGSLDEVAEIVYPQVFKEAFIRVITIFIILMISLIFRDKINSLSLMTSHSIFGNQNVGSLVFYLFIGIFLLMQIVLLTLSILKKYKQITVIKNNRVLYQGYFIQDFISFSISTIIILYFIIIFIITPCTVSGDSMNDTFNTNDKVVVWHLNYHVSVEDVVVFEVNKENYPSAAPYLLNNEINFFIKRIIAVSDDIVVFEEKNANEGRVFVNGIFVQRMSKKEFANIFDLEELSPQNYTQVIPPQKVMVFGDNRGNSVDSRIIGLINEKDIVGKVVFRLFPFDSFGVPKKDVVEN